MIVTVFGAFGHGPVGQGLSRLAIESVQDLGLTFGPG